MLVSVIVPAYNVEKYIEKCLRTILVQTYRKFELLVINDGSEDNSANIIDLIAKEDPRVRVFHTANKGVSAARNFGIQNAKGDYLVFVDGDDFLESDYLEYMLGLVSDHGVDFALSKECFSSKFESQTVHLKTDNINGVEATALLLSPKIIVGCWNKIFKRSLIISNDISFSTSLFYGEGLTFIIDVAKNSKKVAVGNKKVYHYRKNNENSATTKFSIDKLYNGEEALIKIGQKLTNSSKMVNDMFLYHFCLFRLGALVQVRTHNLTITYQKDYDRWLKYVRGNALSFIFNPHLSIYRKLLLISGAVSPTFLSKLDSIRRKKIQTNSVNG
ncbi:glycosyltransferase family 2 protein [Aeromonas veronii]|uniref:glycosyltransferase family 2 protein n=1 Tax=Aeromonas veronii TaxID=654 RepID=UPI003D1A3265